MRLVIGVRYHNMCVRIVYSIGIGIGIYRYSVLSGVVIAGYKYPPYRSQAVTLTMCTVVGL
ncbi:hypothetical protein ccbrp13_37970 [Ktedonobacteria bacterium brp13]|nr:hypothetical protein ccbrp13_37970 [Ktedonobacteria bacterium brp13]